MQARPAGAALLFALAISGLVEANGYQVEKVKALGTPKGDWGSVLIDPDTGRTWILIKSEDNVPAWHPVSFESSFDLDVTPPSVDSVSD